MIQQFHFWVLIYPKKTKPLVRKDIGTFMFTAALFTIAKIQKQPKCPSTDEWKKTQCVCVCVCVCVYYYYYYYYSTKGKNEILLFTTWTDQKVLCQVK